MFILGGPQEVDAVFPDATEDGEVVIAIGSIDELVLRSHVEAGEFLARDEVDHATGSVRAVNDRRAVFQNLGAGKRDRRNVGRVDVHTPAIQQHQRLVGAQAAQVEIDRAGQGRAAEVIRLARDRAGDRQAFGKFERGRSALFFQRFLRIDFDGKRGIDCGAADVRTGHDDFGEIVIAGGRRRVAGPVRCAR
jgi:hypothetical protein